MLKLSNSGQALVPILVILVIILILGAGALYLSMGGLLLCSHSLAGEKNLVATEGAMENGLLRVLRNPAYAGESLQVAGIPCTIDVAGLGPTMVTAECDSGRSIRRLQAEVSFIAGRMIIDNLVEIE